MNDLYKKNPIYKTIDLFCAVRGVSIGAMCKSAGVSPGLVTDLKMGRKQTIQIETASKFATALGTDVNTFMNNRYKRGIWDTDTCMKWFDVDTIEDQIYLLVTYGVDLDFFLNKDFPERKKQLESLMFDQTYPPKEKPTGNADGQLPHAGRREILASEGVRILLDADAKVTGEQLEDIIDFIKFQQRKNGR